ncbi:conserved hypothetical protein [Gammaproteobacteria bacterium]
MTTLAEISLEVAKQTLDVQTGVATTGAADSLIDGLNLTQNDNWWKNGTVWLLSGTHAGKVVPVTGYTASTLYFSSLVTSVGLAKYAVARSIIPLSQLILAINQALEEVRVTGIDATLTGNGATEYTLPAGVAGVVAVELVDASGKASPKTHTREANGKLIFRSAPSGTIRVYYKTAPAELSAATDKVNSEINLKWLKWAATANALRWGLRVHGNDPVYKFDEFLNEALKKLAGLRPVLGVKLEIRTA